MPRDRTTAHAAPAQFLVYFAASRGLDPASLISRYGLPADLFENPDGRISLLSLKAMWETLPDLLGCPDLPLVLAQSLRGIERLPFSAHLFFSSPTLGDALQRSVRYQRVMYDNAGAAAVELRVNRTRAELLVDHTKGPLVPPPAAVAFELALTRDFIGRMTGRDVPVLEVTLRVPLPEDRRSWDEHFGTAVRFAAAADLYVFPSEALAFPLKTASESLQVILDRYADRLLATLPPAEDEATIARLRGVVGSLLPDGACTIARAARLLGTSTRSLQRQLEAAGQSFRGVVDEVRRELALSYLRAADVSIADVAFRLGFSDQPAFHRAFVRWTGATPGAYRAARASVH